MILRIIKVHKDTEIYYTYYTYREWSRQVTPVVLELTVIITEEDQVYRKKSFMTNNLIDIGTDNDNH